MTKAEIEEQGHGMGQVMQSSLHAGYPVYCIGLPHWIIIFARVAAHPFTILVGATGPKEVLKVHIICGDTTIAVLAGWQREVLHLPVYQSRIAKIEGHIRVTELVSRDHAITAIENPNGMDGLPT